MPNSILRRFANQQGVLFLDARDFTFFLDRFPREYLLNIASMHACIAVPTTLTKGVIAARPLGSTLKKCNAWDVAKGSEWHSSLLYFGSRFVAEDENIIAK